MKGLSHAENVASPGAEWLSSEAAREAAAASAADSDRLSSGEADTSVGVFELLDKDLLESATSARNAPRPPPLNQEEWLSFLNTEGALLLTPRVTPHSGLSSIQYSARSQYCLLESPKCGCGFLLLAPMSLQLSYMDTGLLCVTSSYVSSRVLGRACSIRLMRLEPAAL